VVLGLASRLLLNAPTDLSCQYEQGGKQKPRRPESAAGGTAVSSKAHLRLQQDTSEPDSRRHWGPCLPPTPDALVSLHCQLCCDHRHATCHLAQYTEWLLLLQAAFQKANPALLRWISDTPDEATIADFFDAADRLAGVPWAFVRQRASNARAFHCCTVGS